MTRAGDALCRIAHSSAPRTLSASGRNTARPWASQRGDPRVVALDVALEVVEHEHDRVVQAVEQLAQALAGVGAGLVQYGGSGGAERLAHHPGQLDVVERPHPHQAAVADESFAQPGRG